MLDEPADGGGAEGLDRVSTKPNRSIPVERALAPTDNPSPSWIDLTVCAMPSRASAPAKL
jgi:hypothetical protein